MNFTNINDPAGVKALLDQLRSSQAWQEIAQPQTEPTPSGSGSGIFTAKPSIADSQPIGTISPHADAPGLDSEPQASEARGVLDQHVPTSSVASLLSQLHAPTAIPSISIQPRVSQPVTPQPYETPASLYQPVPQARSIVTTPVTAPSSARKEDLRNCTFQQALPHLARLSDDPGFVEAISSLRKEQADLERQLWDERLAIKRKHEEKVKVARTKASLIGSGLTQFEADMMSDSFRKELKKFDAERVLPAWDGLVAKQQAKMESLGVPGMYQTTMTADRERQQRVMQVLAGIVGSEGT